MSGSYTTTRARREQVSSFAIYDRREEDIPPPDDKIWAEAFRLAEAAYLVLPLEPGGKDPHECLRHGVDQASREWDQLKKWRERRAPQANLGLAINGFAVADYDPRNDEEHGFIQKLVMVPLLDALKGPRQDTPSGGIHFILEKPEFEVGGKWGGGDVKINGYIAVAPSRRADCDNREYVWTREPPPFTDGTLPQIPLWLRDRPTDSLIALTARLNGNVDGLGDTSGSGVLASIVALAGPALLSREECWTLVKTCPGLEEWRQKHREKECRRKFEEAVENLWREYHPPSEAEVFSEKVFRELEGRSPIAVAEGIKALASRVRLPVATIRQAHRDWMSKNSPVVDIADHYARVVLEKHFKGGEHLVNADGVLWQYRPVDDGDKPIFWQPIKPDQVRKLIEAEITDLPKHGDKRKASIVTDALRLIKDKRAVDPAVFGLTSSPPMVFNCKNVEVHYEDGEWVPKEHRADHYLRSALPVEYDPDARCPTFERMLDQICAAGSRPLADGGFRFTLSRETRGFVEELMASAVMPRKLHPLIAAIVGPGGNGKTTIMEVLERLGGPGVRVSPIRDTWNSRFAAAALASRTVLVDDDISTEELLDTGVLKSLSNPNQKREVEAKGGAHFDIWLNLTTIMLGNDWPPVNDQSIGWVRRTFGLMLTRIFYRPHEVAALMERFSVTTEEELQRDHGCVPANPKLMQKVIDHELPGVLNLLMAAFSRVVERGEIARPARVVEDSRRWLSSVDAVRRFVDEELPVAPEGMASRTIPVNEVYLEFLRWRDRVKLRSSIGIRGFAERLGHAGCRIVRPGNVNSVADRVWRAEVGDRGSPRVGSK